MNMSATSGGIQCVKSMKGLGFYSAKDHAGERSYIVYVFEIESLSSKWNVSAESRVRICGFLLHTQG